MAWLAVDKDGTENRFTKKPQRWYNGVVCLWSTKGKGVKIELIKGSILKLTGKELTWDDEPIEIK